jgi:putative ABC transport system substrate-binding protein
VNVRRALVGAGAAAAIGNGWPLLAQTPNSVARIAWLSQLHAAPGGGRHPWETLALDRLRELGWVEGRNLVVEFRYGQARAELLPGLAAELVALRPDLIIALGTTGIRAVRDATTSIPIVMAGGGDPVGSGLVASLARPGGNITGVSMQGQEIIPKALSLLREAVPQARRIDALGNAANPGNAYFGKVFSEAARALGLQGELLEVRSADDIDAVLAATRADAVLMFADPLFFQNRQRIADAAIKRRLPLGDTAGRFYTLAGNLLSYGVKADEIWLLTAAYADLILRGGKPAEMPIEPPSRYELFINLKTAKAIGVTIPQALLLRADEVIE